MALDSFVRPLCAAGLLICASRLSIGKQGDDRDALKSYYSLVTDAGLMKTPAWNATFDENPPLSARRAIELATAVKNRLVKDVGLWKWGYHRVHLEYKDIPSVGRRWYWRINFEAWFDGMPPEVAPRVDVVVLMNGRTIEPVEAKSPFKAK
jgi:hypothetical protein